MTRRDRGPETRSASPLRIPIFRSLWIATVVSNVGTLMHATAAAWLMTSLTSSPLLVGLVSSAATFPVFLVGLPAGVLADRLDRRKWLIFTQSWMMLATAALGVLTVMGLVTPARLVGLTFLLGLGMALNLPTWQALVQDIVSREHVASAVSLNSISFNLARSVGPALGGWLTAAVGAGAVFLINAISFLGTVGVLLCWRNNHQPLHPESGWLASLGEGFRFVTREKRMRAPMVRVGSFVLFASGATAILPLFARDELGLPASGYGMLVTAFGVGSIGGALLAPRMREELGVNRVVSLAQAGFALAVFGLALSGTALAAGAAMALAGVCWISVLVNLNVTVQTIAPSKFRGRAMSFYLLTFQGCFALGSALAGGIGSLAGLRGALGVCGAGVVSAWFAARWFPLTALGTCETAPGVDQPG